MGMLLYIHLMEGLFAVKLSYKLLIYYVNHYGLDVQNMNHTSINSVNQKIQLDLHQM